MEMMRGERERERQYIERDAQRDGETQRDGEREVEKERERYKEVEGG